MAVTAVAVRVYQMVMSSHDETLCLWDLKCGGSVVLKEMNGHSSSV
jgi:putative component of membrane protein insertase Oxa1/YidC/SpoIIIJ protein YidD